MPELEKIVKDAEIIEIEGTVVDEQAPQFDLDNVDSMLMVGRFKNGEEFVQPVNTDDVLKLKSYADWALKHYDYIMDRHLHRKFGGQ